MQVRQDDIQTDTAPWSVRGVAMETRAAAKKAAKHARQPLGAWLNRIIREAAAAELTGKPRDQLPANTLEQTVTTLVKLIQERETREEERRAQDAARLAAVEGAAQSQREEAAALRARLDTIERQRQEQEAARRSLFARLFGLK